VLLHAGTGTAGMFICGIGVAVVWAVVYAELGSAYPYAGGDYVGVRSILGPWAGFASLTIWTVTAGPVTAFLAKTIATYFSDLVPAAPPMIVAFCALGAAAAVALLAVRTSAFVTGIFRMLTRFGGWSPKTVKRGDVVTVQGFRAKDGSSYMNLGRIVLPNGQLLEGAPYKRPPCRHSAGDSAVAAVLYSRSLILGIWDLQDFHARRSRLIGI
jgi:hypothetical protein